MKKDKEWLKEEVENILYRAVLSFQIETPSEGNMIYDEIEEKINQLDEPQKPVVPQFVADWIESQDDPIYEMCVNYEMWGVNGDDGTTRFTGEIAEWFDDTLNVENYYRACIDGYEVEKEKRHFIKEPVTGQFLIRDDSQSRGVKWVDGFSTSPSYFTETEIKAIDKRFWAFAVKVEGVG